MIKKKSALEKARSILKKTERAHAPSTIKKKLEQSRNKRLKK